MYLLYSIYISMDDRVKSAFFALFAVNGLFSRVAEEGMKSPRPSLTGFFGL